MKNKPTLAVHKFTSCDGCQLVVLNLEEELLALAAAFDIVRFVEAMSGSQPGPWDVSLVEGSVTTEEEAARIRAIRAQSRYLAAIGACATAGGIQALREWVPLEALKQAVYPAPEVIAALPRSTPASAHVRVDLELPGCPIDKGQLKEALLSLARGRIPALPCHAVCLECKRRGNPCVVVAKGIPCLGPVTRTGCGALCPRFGRGCYGCFGPAEQSNFGAMREMLEGAGLSPEAITRQYRLFTPYHASRYDSIPR